MPYFHKPALAVAAFLVVITFLACTKAGPAGPAGAQGPAGPNGPGGPQGATGDTGTANVIYSAWTSGFSGTSATWTVPGITQGVMDSAAVLVYEGGNGFIAQLPFSNPNGSGFYIIDLIEVGQILLYSNSATDLSGYLFRYVIIPGGVSANYAHMSYQELTRPFPNDAVVPAQETPQIDRIVQPLPVPRCYLWQNFYYA